MTIYEYISLDINSKADALWEKGTFLESWSDEFTQTKLYYLSNFFVEVNVDLNSFSITELTPFKNGYRLDKYLNQIKIET